MAMIGMDVDGLYRHGERIAQRSEHAGAHSHGLLDTLDSASGIVGHPDMAAALSRFTGDLTDHAVKLPGLITTTGHGVSNTAATGRDSDDEGARSVRAAADVVESVGLGLARRINRVEH